MPGRHEYYLFQQEQEESVPFQREAKSVRGEPTPWLFPASPLLSHLLPNGDSGTCPPTPAASHVGVPADHTWITAILLQEGKTTSSYPRVFFAVISTSRSNQGPFPRPLPCSSATCPILGKSPALPRGAVGSCAAVTPLFPLTNLCRVMDIAQRLEFYQLRRANLVPPLKNWSPSYFGNLQQWDAGQGKALAIPQAGLGKYFSTIIYKIRNFLGHI